MGEQEGRRIDNLLRVDDQMICKDDNISEGSTDGATNKYYWRLATAVSSDVVKRGNNVCHWVDLSATDCDTNSDVPEIGDTICHLGNRTDVDRQGAEVLSVVDANSPSFTIYAGINSYSLVNKEYIDMGVINGKAYCNIYGSTYIGDRERKTGYLRWNDDTKTFEIKGTIDISSPLSSGDKNLGEALEDAANAYKGEFDTFTSNVDKVIGDFQKQIDGAIETWFYDPEPTLGNLPASEWKDNTTKDKHLGDLYYSGEGKAYRFQKNGDNYVWQIITDTDITKALEEAKKANDAANAAQGTANSKMKVFVKQPTNNDEYSIGDMWVNATYPADGSTYSNEILKCKEGKAAGAEFTIAHWEKASKYTDDTAAKAAQKTANDAAAAAKDIDDAILAIDNNVDVALKDKIITKTEAAAITEALNSLSAIMADVTKTYAELVNNDVYKLISSDVRTSYKNAYDKLVATFNTLSGYITNTLTKANPITSEILSTYNTHYTNFKTDYKAYVSKLNVVRNSMDALLNTRIGDIASMLGGLKATTDAMDETTQINGGLILSTLLALGYTEGNNFNVMSGVSGLSESDTEKGGGIAFWAGGHRIDINDCTKNADGTYSLGGKVVNPADFLVRHDGTGYAAGGALWWEKDGKVHADPQSFLINKQYVGNVMQLFKFVYSGGTAFENIVHAIPQKPFESLSVGANGLTLYNGENTAKLYIKNGVLFIEGDLAVTGGITMYASDGVKSGLMEQILVDGVTIGKNSDGALYAINTGNVRTIKMGTVEYTPNDSGIVELPAKVTWDNIDGKPSTFTPSAHTHDDRYYTESEIDTKLALKLDTSLKGTANGLATLDASGKVPSSQLPSYVDDVLEYTNKASFPTKGETGKIYIDKATNLTYRWGGTAYVEISQSLALGETSSTAYAGNKGKQNAADIAALKTGKADKATTLTGYGITDAYTKTQTYTQAEVNTKLTDGSVTKVGKVDVGSATKPIYLKAGVPTAVGTSLAVDITGNSATTSKLKTAVTLWGQSFDGSKAITGNLTNVGTITPTGEDLKVVGNLIVTGGIVMYADDGATIESGFAALLAAHIDGVTIKYNSTEQKIYSVMTGIKVNGATYKPSETDGYITIPDYPTSLDWENIENKPSTFAPSAHNHTFASLTSKPTTISGYGITDAKIVNGVITLGTATITPLTTHQKVTLASGTNNGTLKLTVGSKTTDNIAVKGLGSAAYTASSAYAAASHTHSQYLVASSLDGYVNALTDNTSTNVFVTAIAKNGKTLSYTKSFTKKSLTSASHSGWSSVNTDKLIIPDMSFIAYWNGAYNSDGKSNLAYCNKGAFGDMATASKSSYYTKTEVDTKLTDGSVTKVGTANVGATNIPIYLKAGVPTAVTLVDTANNLINNLTTGTSTPVDADYYIAQYVGGGTTTTTYHRRPHSALYGYIKGKAEGTWGISVTGNAATATKLQTARTIWGQSFNGSANVSGAITGASDITMSGALKLNGITISKTSNGLLKIDGNLIVTGGITMYATDGIASGLMEQILVDGTTIKKKADGTLYADINAIGGGTVKGATVGGTAVTLGSDGILVFPAYPTLSSLGAAAASHTHSVTINGSTKTIAATGGTAVDLGTYLTEHQSVTNKAATLAWGTSATIATIGSTNITLKMPANPNTDTKNTAGTTNKTATKMFIVAATEQSANPMTYSNSNVYIGTDNCLYSNGAKVLTAYTDTKNTAGSTDTSSKIFLIGATSQAANPQTYSHDTAYVGTDGCLYSGGTKVLTSHQTIYDLTFAAGTFTEGTFAPNGSAKTINVPTKMTHLTNNLFVKGTQTAATNVWTGTVDGLTAYYDGLTIDYYLPFAGTSTAATLNLNDIGAVKVYNGRGRGNTTTHFPQYSIIRMTYNDGAFYASAYYDSNSTYAGFVNGNCSTAAATAAKSVSATNFTLTAGVNILVRFTQSNTAVSALTLNVNNTGAKTIYINGSVSGSSNYMLPAGTYPCYYDGTYWYVYTDGTHRFKGVMANSFNRVGSSDSYVLLGGGGHKAVSDFATSVHTHAISDITNLQATLDGKAAASHTHAIADITNLSSASVSYAASAGNADTLDGNHASAFALSGHTHSYLPLSGGTIRSGSDTPLIINSVANTSSVFLGFWIGDVAKNYITCMSSGVFASYDNGKNYPFLHTGNYNSYVPTLTGTGASGTWGISISGNAATSTKASYADSAGNADTLDGLHVHKGRNNGVNQIVRTDGNGYIQCGFINSSDGDEGINSSPARVWGTNGSDSYMRTYLTSALSVNYASSAGNADTLDGYHASSFALQGAHNNLMADNNEFTFASSGFSGGIHLNYRTAGGFNGNITEYILCNGKGGVLGTALHTGNYSSYALPLSGGTLTGNLRVNGASIVTNNYLYIEAWPGYGSGSASAWYNGNTSTLAWSCNFSVSGGITMYSDLRKKNVLSDEVLSVKEIALAPLFAHTYKSDENHHLHIGTSAQYWSAIHEGWFTRKDSEGYYQMELQNLGVAMGISLAREIVTFEGAFKKYESKTDKKIKLMKKKINDLEARIKELEGSREERRTA